MGRVRGSARVIALSIPCYEKSRHRREGRKRHHLWGVWGLMR